jgi:feruloyl esterase
MVFVLLCLLTSVLLPISTALSDFEQRCLAFQPEDIIAGATRNILQYVSSNTTLALAGNDATCNRKAQVVSADICRIALKIKTSDKSSIVFEAWLPEKWSGRFLATGNGGIDGCEWPSL